MPEGDTLFRTARTLHRALAGDAIERFASVYAHLDPSHAALLDGAPMLGRTIERVEARGKHLLMFFSGGLVLRTHLRMSGSWHLYRPGESWQRPRAEARIEIATARFVAVGFNVPVAEFVATDKVDRHPELARLGPDLLAPAFDEPEALRRIRAVPARGIAEALLDQSAVAGIGNVFKSEVLFLCGVHPDAAVGWLGDETLRRILDTGRRLLAANVLPSSGEAIVTYHGPRRTTGRSDAAARLWVYGRAGAPCRRCGAAIELAKRGLNARLTFWCPRCQPLPAAAPAP